MADQHGESTEPPQDPGLRPAPVTPSEETERPEGLAFDVEEGAPLPGVPVGDQRPRNPVAAPAREKGSGVGIDVPSSRPARTADEPPGSET